MTGPILIAGGLAATVLIYVGAMLRYGRAHGLLAGYRSATPAEQAKYDVEGLAHHVGNGLMTMGVLLVPATVAALLESLPWCLSFSGLFVLVAFLIVVGGRKFLPDPPQPGDHRLLKAILPERAFLAVRDGTRAWLIECSCGNKDDLWERGGVRFKACGEPRQWTGCPSCGKITWQRVRRKTASERKSAA